MSFNNNYLVRAEESLGTEDLINKILAIIKYMYWSIRHTDAHCTPTIYTRHTDIQKGV